MQSSAVPIFPVFLVLIIIGVAVYVISQRGKK
jgi:hypothetical protein